MRPLLNHAGADVRKPRRGVGNKLVRDHNFRHCNLQLRGYRRLPLGLVVLHVQPGVFFCWWDERILRPVRCQYVQWQRRIIVLELSG